MPITTQQPQYSFPSTQAFFDVAAECAAKAPGNPCGPVPGMVYRIGNRNMQYQLNTAAPRERDQIRLVEVRDAKQGRFRAYFDALLRILGIRRSTTATPTQAQRHEIFTAASGRRVLRDLALERWKKELAAPTLLRDDVVKENRIHTVVAHFTPEVRTIMEAVRHLYGHYPAARATAMVIGVTERINRELDAWLEPLSPEVAAQVRFRLAKLSRIEQFEQIATVHATDPTRRQLELGKVLRFAASEQCLALSYDLDARPERLGGLAPFNEVALGDMHGNCELLMHTLVQLGFLHIVEPDAWDTLRGMLRKLQKTPMTATDLLTFRQNLRRAVTVDPACLETRLTLLGDLLADRMHNDICMLAILDLLHQLGVNYQVILSNHDMGFIHYYLGNRSKSRDEAFQIRGIGVKEATSLERCDALLNAHRGTRDYFRDAAERAYFPYLNVCSTSLDGQTFFSHGFVNQTLFAELCRDAGAGADEPLAVQSARINDYLRNLMAGDGAGYRATVTDNSAVVGALYATGWNIGPGDSRYQNETAVAYPTLPRINDPRLPRHELRRAVHGHTQNVSARLRRERERDVETAKLLEAIEATKDAEKLVNLNAYLRSPWAAWPNRQVLSALSPRIARHLVRAARGLDTASDGAQRLAQLRTSLSSSSMAAMNDLTPAEAEKRNRQFFDDFTRAWNAICNTGGDPIKFHEVWATQLYSALESELTEQAVSEPLPPLMPVVDDLRKARQEFDSIAASMPSDAVPPAGPDRKEDAYLGALEWNFISLDSSDGMLPDHRKFARTVYVV